MKKKLCTMATIFALALASSITAFAAPEVMPDGGMFDAEYYAQNNPDVVAVFGTDKELLYSHYVNNGRAEGRQGFQITADMYTTCPVASQKTLELLAIGGTEGVHYKADGDWKYYKLGDKKKKWGELALERTDFPDGLIDLDGNGIDDRDPINSLGYIDLNLNGIDDRAIISFGNVLKKPDLEKYALCTEDRYHPYELNNYICEHGVVCKTDNYVDKLCLKCRAIEEAQKAEYARRHSGHVSDDKGYKIGSTVTGYDSKGNAITLTYQGNDVWSGSDGGSWEAYLDENDCIRWSSGIR